MILAGQEFPGSIKPGKSRLKRLIGKVSDEKMYISKIFQDLEHSEKLTMYEKRILNFENIPKIETPTNK